MKILIRVFPTNRRGSFISLELTIDKCNPKVKDIFQFAYNDLKDKCKVSRGVYILDMNDDLIDGDILNIIPV